MDQVANHCGLYLPHLITTTDIENIYGGKVSFIPEILEMIQAKWVYEWRDNNR